MLRLWSDHLWGQRREYLADRLRRRSAAGLDDATAATTPRTPFDRDLLACTSR